MQFICEVKQVMALLSAAENHTSAIFLGKVCLPLHSSCFCVCVCQGESLVPEQAHQVQAAEAGGGGARGAAAAEEEGQPPHQQVAPRN